MPEGLDLNETFVVNKATYRLVYERDMWVVRRSGCQIFEHVNKIEARIMLHTYAVNQARAEARTYRELADQAQNTLDRLSDDPFHLGRFLA